MNYTRRTWDHGKANQEATNNAFVNFDSKKFFLNINVHTKVKLFNEILNNIFTRFVPNKLITVDDRNPPWVI